MTPNQCMCRLYLAKCNSTSRLQLTAAMTRDLRAAGDNKDDKMYRCRPHSSDPDPDSSDSES